MPQGINILAVQNASTSTSRENSNTIIALVGTAVSTDIDDALKKILVDNKSVLSFSNIDVAINTFKTIRGTIREDLEDIKAQNVLSPIIISLVEISEEVATNGSNPQSFYGDSAEIKTAIIDAVDNARYVRTIYKSKIDILIASWWSWDEDVRAKIDSLCVFLDCISIIDLNQDNISNANIVLDSLGSTRYLSFPFFREVWSIYTSANMIKPNGALVAGHIAFWDSKLGEFGYCFDHANREIFGAGKSTVILDYMEGKPCGVNNLVGKGASLIVNDDGDKLYNFETSANNEIFNKLERVRAFIGLNRRLQDNLKKYKHRPIDSLALIKVDVESFLGSVKLAGALIGYKVEFSKRNTPEALAEGKLYIDYSISSSVGIREITIQPFSTSEFYSLGGN